MTNVEQGIQSQLRNIERTYGKTIEELVRIVTSSGLTKHGDVVTMLKQRHGMAHAAAHRVSLVARSRQTPPAKDPESSSDPVLKEVYDRLMEAASSLGNDVESSPKTGYVSLRRRKQFAMLQAGKKWINLGLILPNHPPSKRLESAVKWNALFTHRVRVATTAEIDRELKTWLNEAYQAAG